MRRFNSYGPVDCEAHFCVERKDLVNQCVEQLIGDTEKGGHYFTLWAPRQTGKTWVMRQAKKMIENQCKDRFAIHCFSFGDLRGMRFEPTGGVELPAAFSDVLEIGLPGNPTVKTWKEFWYLFSKDRGLWNKPLILMVDEVDMAPPQFLDLVVGRFREMYLDRRRNCLHGLALIGVRAVLGVESERGSPFNIQRSLHVPKFTQEEVTDLFQQYQEESGQTVGPDVIQSVFETTRGQPGLVGWFGELLTENYNPGKESPIDMNVWNEVFRMACVKEWNNTVLNLVKKARGKYQDRILALFSRPNIPFTIDSEWQSFAYLNGIIDSETVKDAQGKKTEICRFANPFIQHRLYNAFMLDVVGEQSPILALEPFDKLTDVFDKPEIDIPALLKRYKGYLARLKAAGLNPWKNQPRRADLHLREAVGHFHLYFWLQNAIGKWCVISPEFPTGNGRVDLRVQCKERHSVIEVKSYKDQIDLEDSQIQAASYAQKLNLPSIALAVFVPLENETILDQLSEEMVVDGVRVAVVAIGWV